MPAPMLDEELLPARRTVGDRDNLFEREHDRFGIKPGKATFSVLGRALV